MRRPPLRSLVPDVPETFERLVLRCLERDVEKRFQSVGALARELIPYVPFSNQPVVIGLPVPGAPSWKADLGATFPDQVGSTLVLPTPKPETRATSGSQSTLAARSWGRRLALALPVAGLALVVRFAFSSGMPVRSMPPAQPSAAPLVEASVARTAPVPPPPAAELGPSVTPTLAPLTAALSALPRVSATASAKPRRTGTLGGAGGRPGRDANGGGAGGVKPGNPDSGAAGRSSKVDDPALSDR